MLFFSRNMPERKGGRIITIDSFIFDDMCLWGKIFLCHLFLWLILGLYKLVFLLCNMQGAVFLYDYGLIFYTPYFQIKDIFVGRALFPTKFIDSVESWYYLWRLQMKLLLSLYILLGFLNYRKMLRNNK